uniref:Uncharacterized protein n=1 Tax=viral metagenome TaxID=1070528 RepID=A0A6H1ZF97_9ZZZZ
MTNKEMVQVLKRVRKHVIDVSEIDTVIAALESEPEPLAVVEGWIDEWILKTEENPLAWVNQILRNKPRDSLLPLVPVTVTITKRKE